MGPGHPIATFQRYASPLQAARVQVDLRNVEAEGLTVRPLRTSLAPQKPKAQPFKTQAVPCPPLTAASVPVMPKGSVAAAWLAKGTPVPAKVGAGGSGSCSCSFRGVPVPKQRGVRVAPPVKHAGVPVAPPVKHAGVQAAQFMLAFIQYTVHLHCMLRGHAQRSASEISSAAPRFSCQRTGPNFFKHELSFCSDVYAHIYIYICVYQCISKNTLTG